MKGKKKNVFWVHTDENQSLCSFRFINDKNGKPVKERMGICTQCENPAKELSKKGAGKSKTFWVHVEAGNCQKFIDKKHIKLQN